MDSMLVVTCIRCGSSFDKNNYGSCMCDYFGKHGRCYGEQYKYVKFDKDFKIVPAEWNDKAYFIFPEFVQDSPLNKGNKYVP